MKRIIATLLMVLMVAGTLAGCGKKDYSFTQEEWDKNDLSFIENTADPNEAYRVISYFASRYEDYYAGYVTSRRAEEYNCIRLGSATIESFLVIDYYILEDEETAKKCYEQISAPPQVFNGEILPLEYGDEGTNLHLVFNDETSNYNRYVIRDGNCVLEIWPLHPEYNNIMESIEDFLDYMY